MSAKLENPLEVKADTLSEQVQYVPKTGSFIESSEGVENREVK